MPGSTQLCLLILLAWIPEFLLAQVPVQNTQEMEELLYRSESSFIPEPELIATDPAEGILFDLNNATSEELEASRLFTSYQLHNLLLYREKYGPLYSLYELQSIPGFHQRKVLEIEPVVSLGNSAESARKKPMHPLLLVHMERTYPVSNEYLADSVSGRSGAYMGSPLKTTIRFRTEFGEKFSLALTYEKDAGEPYLYKRRPQFLSGFLSYENKGIVRQVVLGSFKMNQGLGLLHGAGFIHQAGHLVVNHQSISRIRPYASKTESSYEQGLACQLQLNKFGCLMWLSCRQLSLSPAALSENPGADKWLEYERTSGLFRTTGELEGRALAFRIHTGTQVVFRYRQLSAGFTGGSEWIYPTGKAMESLTAYPDPVVHHKAGLHTNWQHKKIQVFGEISTGGQHSVAGLLGTEYNFSDFIQGGFLLHHYGKDYRGFNPSSYASGSKTENEQGVAFHLRIETGRFLTAELTGELFRFQSPRYLCMVPSTGNRLNLALQNPGEKQLQWRIRLVTLTRQTTPANEQSRVRSLKTSGVTRLDWRLIYNYQDLVLWQSRLVLSRYSEQTVALPAYAALQQLTISSDRKLKTSVQFVLFHIKDWENRIYLYEPGFYYSFNFPAYYGKGQKFTLLLILKPVPRITISAKFSGITKLKDRTWDTSLQLQIKL